MNIKLEIPYDLLLEHGIKKSTTQILYGALKFYCCKQKKTYVSDTTLSNFLNVNVRTIQLALNDLEKNGCIYRKKEEGKRFIYPLLKIKNDVSTKHTLCKVYANSNIYYNQNYFDDNGGFIEL